MVKNKGVSKVALPRAQWTHLFVFLLLLTSKIIKTSLIPCISQKKSVSLQRKE
jgi:hypothetical protein